MIARKTVQVPIIAVVVALSATVIGILASVRWDLPSGPCIVAALIAEAGCVWAAARVSS
jgi:ABC-type Mn2+/Zn2+ transport system permease subunit